MAPRSTSPVRPPAWLVELLQQVNRMLADLHQQDSAIRELRSISLETQHLIRTRLQSTVNCVTESSNNVSIQRAQRTTSVATISTRPANSIPTGTITNRPSRINQPRGHNGLKLNRTYNLAVNQAVRNAAIPLPRPTTSTVNRICWYHRQFGITSANCISPCSFSPPPTPQAAPSNHTFNGNTSTNSATKRQRIPVMQSPNTQPLSITATIEDNLAPESPNQNNIASQQDMANNPRPIIEDWTAEDELDVQYPQLSESSSSSSSDSEDEDPNRKTSSKGE